MLADFGLSAALAFGLVGAPQDVAKLEVATEAVAETPKGFTAIFNGKDLAGWHGQDGGMSPVDLMSKPRADQKALFDKWNADAAKHWSVQNG
jgi:hypothetical protein